MNAEKSPLSPEGLQQEADLIVAGQVERLRIETERSQPETGEPLEVEAPLPDDMAAVLAELREFR